MTASLVDEASIKHRNESAAAWVARRNRRRKICLTLTPIVLIVALALGLGVGLGIKVTRKELARASPTPGEPLQSAGNATTWQPAVGSSWQIALDDPLDLAADATAVVPDVDIYDIDLFDNNKTAVDTLHRLGKKVICYFSAGSYEPGRPDSGEFVAADKGKGVDGAQGEFWLDLNSSNVRSIMGRRLDLAAQKGCDAVDPDNVGGYDHSNGLGLTQDDSVDFLGFLAGEAQKRNVSIGLKNAGALTPRVLPVMQFSVNEECVEFLECAIYAPFIKAGKPVFHIEYPDGAPKVSAVEAEEYCASKGDGDGSEHFSTVLKEMSLNGFVRYCDGESATTPLLTTGSKNR